MQFFARDECADRVAGSASPSACAFVGLMVGRSSLTLWWHPRTVSTPKSARFGIAVHDAV